MATTINEGAKKQIIKILRQQGYPTYAWLLEPFDVYLTDDPEVIGYMLPGKAKIVLNENLSTSQVSTIVRHEILHEYLTHAKRTDKFHKSHPDRMTTPDLANIAADFEISNRGYTDEDKNVTRGIIMGDRVLQGLVTEDEYPGWEDLTFEEMYDKLTDEYTKNMEKLKKQLQPLLDALSKLSKKDLDDLMDQAAQSAQGNSGQSSQKGTNNSQEGTGTSQEEAGDETGDGDSEDGSAKGAAGDSPEAKKLRGQAQQLADQIEDVQDKVEGAKGDPNKPIQSDSQQRDAAKVAAQVEEIQKRLDDVQARQAALDETDRAVSKEKIKTAERREINRLKNPLVGFRMNFQRFIKDQIDMFRGDTWHRPNKNYTGTDYILPGKTMYAPNKIPKINVYWDVSGSFSNPAKTAGARAAIATINSYAKRGLIQIDTYYFADRVSSTANSAGGGTEGQPILDHITQTNPTNVVIITDGDISDCNSYVTVPGAVWMLFFDRESENLIGHLKGKKQTKQYLIYNY